MPEDTGSFGGAFAAGFISAVIRKKVGISYSPTENLTVVL